MAAWECSDLNGHLAASLSAMGSNATRENTLCGSLIVVL